MTVIKKMFYRNFPYSYRIKKSHYWDKVGNGLAEDQVLDIKLEPYDQWPEYGYQLHEHGGENNCAAVFIAGAGTLPNLEPFNGFTGCIAYRGKNYHIKEPAYCNFDVIGAPELDSKSGVISGFSAANYIRTPVLPAGDYFDCIVKADFSGTSSSEDDIWFSSVDRPIGVYKQKFGVYQSGWTTGTTAITAGNTYWFRAIYNKGVLNLYVLPDNDGLYTLDTLPVLSSWYHEVTDKALTANPFAGVQVLLSRNNSSYWKGRFHLAGARISNADGICWEAAGFLSKSYRGVLNYFNDDGEEHLYHVFADKFGRLILDTNEKDRDDYLWVGKFLMPKHTVYLSGRAQFTIYGDLWIVNGFAKRFNETSYLVTDTIHPGMGDTDYILRVKTGSDSSEQSLLYEKSYHNYGIGTGSSKRWRLCDTTAHYGGSFEYNTWYWVRLKQNCLEVGKRYITEMSYMLDDGTYDRDTIRYAEGFTSVASSETEKSFFTSVTMIVGGSSQSISEYWKGEVDLAQTRFYYTSRNTPEPIDLVSWIPIEGI